MIESFPGLNAPTTMLHGFLLTSLKFCLGAGVTKDQVVFCSRSNMWMHEQTLSQVLEISADLLVLA